MKRLFIVLIMAVLGLSSFVLLNAERPAYGNAPRQAGLRVVDALRHSSVEMYLEMFPTLDQFQTMMKRDSLAYGTNLEAAQQEFAYQYMNALVPSVQDAFEDLIKEGEERGVKWSEVEFVRWEVDQRKQEHWSVIPFVLVISFREKEYQIRMERTLVIDGQIKVNQFVKLI